MNHFISSFLSYFRQHKLFLILYCSFLITGLIIFKDYGISWDEAACRYDIGLINHNFIFHSDYNSLTNSIAKYHGPAFEVLLFETELILKLDDPRDVFLMRHLLTFLLFALSVFFFYLLCLKIFKDKRLAVIGTLMLILSPRIFADSFYNSKDLGFLSMWIISMFTTLKFLEKRTYKTALINALVTGFMIDIRIIGIIIPAFTGFILLLGIIRNSEKRLYHLKVFGFFIFFLIGFIIIFWPVMWRNPIDNFMQALLENGKFPWQGEVLFNARLIPGDNLPFYYLPFWIGVTTPVLYLLLFLSGLFFLVKKSLLRREMEVSEGFTLSIAEGPALSIAVPERSRWAAGLNLYSFFLPIVFVIALHSVLYDGWRHLFFIYPSFIIISIYGLSFFISFLKNSFARNIFVVVLALYGGIILIQMIVLHPFENLYFNRMAGKSLKEIKEKYELDYWALSYRNCLEYIVEHDTSSTIWVYGAESSPAFDNTFMLKKKDRSRVFTTESREVADYYVTAYRYIRDSISRTPFYNLVRDNGIIASVYNTKELSAEVLAGNYLVAQQNRTYEEPEELIKPYISLIQKDSRTNHAEKVDQKIELAAETETRNLNLRDTSAKMEYYLVATFEVYSDKILDFKFVTEIDTADKLTGWSDKKNISITNPSTRLRASNAWTRKEIRLSLPDSLLPRSVLRTYILNDKQNEFYIDDISIKFYCIPKEVIKNILKKIPKPKRFMKEQS